MNMIF